MEVGILRKKPSKDIQQEIKICTSLLLFTILIPYVQQYLLNMDAINNNSLYTWLFINELCLEEINFHCGFEWSFVYTWTCTID